MKVSDRKSQILDGLSCYGFGKALDWSKEAKQGTLSALVAH
jgi:hypothetical protein